MPFTMLSEECHKRKVWVIVRVWRGMPIEVKLFSCENTAINYKEQLDKSLPIEDEIALFQVPLPVVK